MPRPLEELHTDHKNLAKMLGLLEEQLEILKADGDGDLCLIIDIIDYIQSYPDFIHHPREDVIYHYYLRNCNADASGIHELLAEHEEIVKTTTAIRNQFESLLNDGMVSREELINDLESFIRRQKQHMDTEEGTVFPMLEAALTDQDWEAIEALTQAKNDPLFGEVVQESFRGLYERILD